MSTWSYLECKSHTPPIRSDEEIEQHWATQALDDIRAFVRNRDAVIPGIVDADGYPDFDGILDVADERRYVASALHFLIKHPHCAIGLVTEYGDREHLVDAASSELRVRTRTRGGRR